MHIYEYRLTLLEATFFSSREISNTYYTEPCIGHIALAYAFGLCQAPYFNDGTIYYKPHLSQLNERGIYITPAAIEGQPRFILRQFNAQPDAYWSAMGNNTLVTRPDGTWAEKRGPWYIKQRQDDKGKKVNPETRPQFGRIRALSTGNRARGYVLSGEPLTLPQYIRLGKFMSKARVRVSEQPFDEVTADDITVSTLLSLSDLPVGTFPSAFDLINIPPTPLIRNARLRGAFYKLGQNEFLPQGMRFAVDGLPDQ